MWDNLSGAEWEMRYKARLALQEAEQQRLAHISRGVAPRKRLHVRRWARETLERTASYAREQADAVRAYLFGRQTGPQCC